MISHRLLLRSCHHHRSSTSSVGLARWFSLDTNDEKKTASEKNKPPPPLPSSFLEQQSALPSSLGRGVGQVIFLNNPYCGVGILASLALGDVYLASLATVGTLSATAVAQATLSSKKEGDDDGAIENGLLGYNGCLVGCATAVFIAPTSIASGLLTTVLAGAATPYVCAALQPAMGKVPQWTLSFNIVTLSMLLRSQPLADAPPLPPYTGSAMELLATAPLKGISQIFVVESSLTGAALLATTAYYSPLLAGHALLGSSIGALTGYYCIGVEASELAMGLWGFNSALTSLGVGVFFVSNRTSWAVSAGGAAATAVLFGALQKIFGASPCLTMPFCITMSGIYLMKMPNLKLATNAHSPEKNE